MRCQTMQIIQAMSVLYLLVVLLSHHVICEEVDPGASDFNPDLNPKQFDEGICECDLTIDHCDLDCCCDLDCGDAAAPCPPRDPLGPASWLRCSAPAAGRPAWLAALCVAADNTPFLGSFFGAAPAAELALFRGAPGWARGGGRDRAAGGGGYRSGAPLLRPDGRPLLLPRALLDGRCERQVTAPYLRPADVRCEAHDLRALCGPTGAGSPLDPAQYEGMAVVATPAGETVTARLRRRCRASEADSRQGEGQREGGKAVPCPRRPLEMDGDTCRNALSDLLVLFHWNGSQIVDVEVSMFIVDVPAPDGSVNLTQTFEIEFRHAGAGGVSEEAGGSTVRRSGNPGYAPDALLISANEELDLSAVASLPDRLSPLLSLRPGSDGACGGVAPVRFLRDTATGCLLSLPPADLADCTRLRRAVADVWSQLDSAGRFVLSDGSLNATTSRWVPVLSEPEEAVDLGHTAEDGGCTLPTARRLEVLYAETGRVDEHPVWAVVGARVSYNTSVWRAASRPVVCLLSSSAVFTEVDVSPPSRLSRFWAQWDNARCDGDVCWSELLYPLTASFRGEPLATSLQDVLLVCTLLVATALFTRHLW